MNFEEIYKINVNDYTEEKNGLTYLSWAYAWREFKKIYPDATYEIKKFENNLPYVYDENTGYMVFTSVTAGGLTYEMWLPVMDNTNKTMKSEAYKYSTKYGEKTVDPATMFDVNKTIMRCLVKNLAMFGLGLYIYAGEDIPKTEETDELESKISEKLAESLREAIDNKIKARKYDSAFAQETLKKYGYRKIVEIKAKDLPDIKKELDI